jgi:hypothetical protein
MQELILEPYAGLVFGFSPGQSTSLSGAQNGGVFVGMLLVGIAATGLRIGSLRHWVVAGCLGSALALAVIAALASWRRGLDPGGRGAWLLQRHVRGGGHRVDDGAGGRGARAARRHADGPVGCVAGGGGGGGRASPGHRAGRPGAPVAAPMPRPSARSSCSRPGCSFCPPDGRAGDHCRGGAASPAPAYAMAGENDMSYDVFVVGGGPSGATAAEDLARAGHRVALLDRAGGSSPAAGPSRPGHPRLSTFPTGWSWRRSDAAPG